MKVKSNKIILSKIFTVLLLMVLMLTGISANQANAATIKKSGVTLTVGSSKTLKTGVSGKVTSWSSSKKEIATVDKNGKVKAVKAGKTTITAIHSNKNSYTFTVTVKNADAIATSIVSSTEGGGDFYPGVNKQKISFVLDKKSTAVNLSILDDEEKTIFTNTFDTISANKEKSYNWDGKNSKGNYVPEGIYKIRITAGAIKTDSNYFKVYVKNPFSGGVGSEDNPYEISTIKHFELISQYNGRYFIQTEDFDFEYASIKSLFTTDSPFTGGYNGNGKSISNFTLTSSLFTAISTDATLINISLVNGTLNAPVNTYNALLVGINQGGKIENCSVKDGFASSNGGIALLVGMNEGTIKNCNTSGTVKSSSKYRVYNNGEGSGGIVAYNGKNGKILSSNSSAYISDDYSHYNPSYTGGIVALNDGMIVDCTSNGIVEQMSGYSRHYKGGIAGKNTSSIQYSSYTGASTVDLVGLNEGVID